jgi:hypothetical protein
LQSLELRQAGVAVVWHPLDETTEAGTVQFDPDAEAVLERLPRRGPPMILQERQHWPFKPNRMAKLVRELADDLGLRGTFTLDACRHGGMTELEEAELTTGQGKALSGHRSDRAYRGYAEATQDRALAATRKRHAHRLTNESGTKFRNEEPKSFRNEGGDDDAAIA